MMEGGDATPDEVRVFRTAIERLRDEQYGLN
jgi:hypothetical protein